MNRTVNGLLARCFVVSALAVLYAPLSNAQQGAGSEAKAAETKGTGAKATETKAAETKGGETKASETKGPDAKGPDAKGPDAKGADAKGAGTKPPDAKGGETRTQGAPSGLGAQPSGPAPPGPAGVDQAVIVVPATSDEASAKVLLRGLDAPPIESAFELGLLKSIQQPGLLIVPKFELVSATPGPTPPAAGKGDYVAELKIHQLVAFGESSVAVSHLGKLVQVLHFSKPGLVARASGEGGLVAREKSSAGDSSLIVVLENPSAFEYKSVRARLRFGDYDVCVFESDRFVAGAATTSTAQGTPTPGAEAKPISMASCNQYGGWTEFSVPQYAQVTLRAKPDPNWFVDPDRGLARVGKQKGALTLRFQSASGPVIAGAPIFEQTLPLEAQFEPSTWQLFRSLLCVASLLVAGAILSLLLRVSLPNLKRRRDLKDQLAEVAKSTASISAEVDSNLRVLLGVERLALDEIRRGEWTFGPSYAEAAQRVERALPTLKRRVDAVRQLDATLIRRRLLAEQGAAPTRLEQVEALLGSVSEILMHDQLSEADWVSVGQRLEAAQKILREPTQAEKDAFDAMLAVRWKNIREHFDKDEDGILDPLPTALAGMESCVPNPSLLPKPKDTDGSTWIKAVGTIRADLQLSALQLLWDFEFLAPAKPTAGPWTNAKTRLTELLATPALENLREARRLLRELAEGVSEDDIKADLKKGMVRIIMDPPLPRPNQKVRFAVCFRRNHLNSAAAREDVSCHWSFQDKHELKWYSKAWAWRGVDDWKERRHDLQETNTTPLPEEGWYVHHYFEKGDESTISVSFYDSAGQPVELQSADGNLPWYRKVLSIRESRRPQEKWGRARLELFQLTAALLVPLATLASTTLSGAGSAHWWELIAIGFGSDTIKSILVGRQESSSG